MANVTEDILEMSARLFMDAASDLSRAVVGTGEAAATLSKEAMVALINQIKNGNISAKEKKALEKLQGEVEKGEILRQVTILESDLPVTEKWLKKKDVLYVALRSDKFKGDDGYNKCLVKFLDKDFKDVETALSLARNEQGLINELTVEALLFKNDKKDISVVDNLDVYEIGAFREIAKDYGLVFSVISTPADETENKAGDSYKIIVSKKDIAKAAAIMQQISWCMTGEFQEGIKEKIKERYSIKEEVQMIVRDGVAPGKVSIDAGAGGSVTVDKAKYIVNRFDTNQYIKITAQGFAHFKFGKEIESVSIEDAEYDNKIQLALGEFSDAVVFDEEEWENENLSKKNRRKNSVEKKASVFPAKFNKEKDIEEMQKARKEKKKDEREPLEETAWLFDRYDSQKLYSEVYEVNYNNPSKPPEETVSVHYGNATKHAEKYKYIDVANDEKTIDNIILSAKARSKGYDEREQVAEKEAEV